MRSANMFKAAGEAAIGNAVPMDAAELLSQGALTVPDAIRFSGIGRTQIYDAMGRGDLVFTRSGSRRLIPKVALIQLLAKGLTGGTESIEGK